MYKNGLICRTAFDLMTDCMDKLYRIIDHRLCEMLPSNATVETLATTTVALPRLKMLSYAEHALVFRVRCETNTTYSGDDGIYCYLDMGR